MRDERGKLFKASGENEGSFCRSKLAERFQAHRMGMLLALQSLGVRGIRNEETKITS
jgi:hypothetical protein